ncbi:MAG: MFS transporter [Ignisphaera sp.]
MIWIKYYWIWVIHSIFYSFAFTFSTAFYQAYAIRVLGYSVDELGNITFLNLAAISLGSFVSPILVNRYRHRRVVLWKVFTSLNIISWSLSGFSDIVSRYMLFFYIALAQFTGAIGGMAYSDLIADMIPKEKSIKIFSKVNTYTTLSSLVSLSISVSIFVGLGSSIVSYRICYSITIVSAIISAAFLWKMKDLVQKKNEMTSIKYVIKVYRDIVRKDVARGYIVFISLFTFFANMPAALWNYYIIKVFNGTELWISVNNIMNLVAGTLGNYLLSKVSHRLNPKKTIVYSIIPISFVPTIFLFSSTLSAQAVMNLYSGLSWTGFNLIVNIYNLYLAGEKRVYMIALLGVLNNLAASIASRLGSAIASINLLAMQMVFVMSTIGRLSMYFYARKNLPNI